MPPPQLPPGSPRPYSEVDAALLEEEMSDELLRVLNMVRARQEELDAHVTAAQSILRTVEAFASRIEALVGAPLKAPPTSSSSSSAPQPPPHTYGVELDLAESRPTHVDPNAAAGDSPTARFIAHFTPRATRQQQQQQQQQRPSAAFPLFRPSAAATISAPQASAAAAPCMQADPNSRRNSGVTPSLPTSQPKSTSAAAAAAAQRDGAADAPRALHSSPQQSTQDAGVAGTRRETAAAVASPMQRLKGRSPPALAQKESGPHSPTHASNSTSPFFMERNQPNTHAQVDAPPGGANSASCSGGRSGEATPRTAAGAEPAASNEERRRRSNTFDTRLPSQTQLPDGHEQQSPAAASSPPAPPLLYPTNAAAESAQLTAFEEQEPRGSGWGIPSVVVLRHRMGFSTVVLTPHQRATYSRFDLEKFILYKEQKYNAVNVLWRFAVLLVFILTFSVFCLVFSLCTTEWVSLRRAENYLSVGMFVRCQDSALRVCEARLSSRLEWQVVDSVTGGTLCSAPTGFVNRFVGAMWSMAILQLLCELLALTLTARILARPTRSGALELLFCVLLLGTASGIVAVVLFHHYSACLRRTCEGAHLSGVMCTVSWQYGYRLYMGALAIHGVLLLLALCMHSFIHNIRVTSRKQLRAERRRSSQRHAEAEAYMVHFMDSSVGGGGSGEGTGRRLDAYAATRRGGEAEGGSLLAPADSHAHSSLHVSFAGDPRTHHSNYNSGGGGNGMSAGRGVGVSEAEQRRQRSPLPRQISPTTEQTSLSRANTSFLSHRGDAAAAVSTASDLTQRVGAEPNAPAAAAASRRDGRRGNSPSFPVGSAHQPQHHRRGGSGKSRRRGAGESGAYRQARKRNRFLTRFFNREYDANYLTAAELGVPIDGANDWVYDDRSDMYYSFDRNMFWDPLTREYYNCSLKTWQESPNQVVEVRDVLDFMLQESDGDGEMNEREGDNDNNGGIDTRSSSSSSSTSSSEGERATVEEHAQGSRSNNSIGLARRPDARAGQSSVDAMAVRGGGGPSRRTVQHHGEPVTADSSAVGGANRSCSQRLTPPSDDDDAEEHVFSELQ